MQTIWTALTELREKGARFVQLRQIRLLLVRASADSRDRVLQAVSQLESHPDNTGPWVFLFEPTALEELASQSKLSGGAVLVLAPRRIDADKIEGEMEALLNAPALAKSRFVLVLDNKVPLLPRLMRAVGEHALACDCRVGRPESPAGRVNG